MVLFYGVRVPPLFLPFFSLSLSLSQFRLTFGNFPLFFSWLFLRYSHKNANAKMDNRHVRRAECLNALVSVIDGGPIPFFPTTLSAVEELNGNEKFFKFSFLLSLSPAPPLLNFVPPPWVCCCF